MAVAEDIWDQLSHLEKLKVGYCSQDKVKNSLCSFAYNYVDLDLREYNIDHKKIRILNKLSRELSILKPDKGNGIVVIKHSDYISSVTSLFSDTSRFHKLDFDPTTTHLSTLQAYLNTVFGQGEISALELNFLKLTAGHFGREHGLPKIHKKI